MSYRTKSVRRILSTLVAALVCCQAGAWQSSLLKVQADGSLTYKPDADGFCLPDFSHAGYAGGDREIPQVPVVKTISPVKGDNTAHIQQAIDELGALTPNADGIRGTLLLQAGVYRVSGTLLQQYSGVVIRGVGQDTDSTRNTIILATGDTPHQRDVLIVGHPTSRIWGSTQRSGSKQNITDERVQVGSMQITLNDASAYSVGQQVIIYHPCSANWIAAVNQGGVPYPDPSEPTADDERWTTGSLPITYHRYITDIQSNTLTLDAPIFYTLDRSISQSYAYIPNMDGTRYELGIERLRIDVQSAGGTDENHAWNAVRFRSCENAWATDCTFSGFGLSGIITEACRRSTFARCSAIDPVAIVTGSRMYNFCTYLNSQLNLFDHCYARAGRHHYMSNGTSGTSGNVFLYCTSDAVQNVNEGHRQWTQGMLYDNHKEQNLVRPFVLGLYNRVAMGTGHGWAAVQSVLWNCDVDSKQGRIGLQKPPTSQNYAIGCMAQNITGNPIAASNFTRGYVEGQNAAGLEPQSLYEAQHRARHQATATPEITSPDIIQLDAERQHLTAKDHIDRLNLWSISGQLIMSLNGLEPGQHIELPDMTHLCIAQIINNQTSQIIKIIR
ncbi:MAG: hypothetical protein IJ680_03295 [Paludibacteraceae bacterium]|nr:hypothetical protein [Paludibacteraceae bacterium]